MGYTQGLHCHMITSICLQCECHLHGCQHLHEKPSIFTMSPYVQLPLVHLQIRRPNNYDYNVAVTLGFTEPNPVIDLGQLEIVRTVVQDTPNKLFIGGLPCEWTEDQV